MDATQINRILYKKPTKVEFILPHAFVILNVIGVKEMEEVKQALCEKLQLKTQRVLSYFLTVSIVEVEEIGTVEVYGIRVEEMSQTGERSATVIHNITSNRKRMEQFIYKIAKGAVFAGQLQDVVEDFLLQ